MASDIYCICMTVLSCIQNSLLSTKLTFVRQKWDVSLLLIKLSFVRQNWILSNPVDFHWRKLNLVEQNWTEVNWYKSRNLRKLKWNIPFWFFLWTFKRGWLFYSHNCSSQNYLMIFFLNDLFFWWYIFQVTPVVITISSAFIMSYRPNHPFGVRRELVSIMSPWETHDSGPCLNGSSIINNNLWFVSWMIAF